MFCVPSDLGAKHEHFTACLARSAASPDCPAVLRLTFSSPTSSPRLIDHHIPSSLCVPLFLSPVELALPPATTRSASRRARWFRKMQRGRWLRKQLRERPDRHTVAAAAQDSDGRSACDHTPPGCWRRPGPRCCATSWQVAPSRLAQHTTGSEDPQQSRCHLCHQSMQ